MVAARRIEVSFARSDPLRMAMRPERSSLPIDILETLGVAADRRKRRRELSKDIQLQLDDARRQLAQLHDLRDTVSGLMSARAARVREE